MIKHLFTKHLGVVLAILVVILLVSAVVSSTTRAVTMDELPAPTNLTIEQ